MSDPLLETATNVARALAVLDSGVLPQEVILVDAETVAIVTEIEGLDYVLTLGRISRERPRPARN